MRGGVVVLRSPGRRCRRLVAVAVTALATACALPSPAGAQFQLPLYQRVAPVPVVCESTAEWAADPFAHQIADQASYTSLDGNDRIVLSPRMCLGLLLLALDPAGRHDTLNERNGVAVAWTEAAAARILGHEIAHVTLRNDDETAAACFARALAPGILTLAGVRGERLATLIAHVDAVDRLLPPLYHAHPC